MVSRHGRSTKSQIDMESLKDDINGIRFLLLENLDERERLTVVIAKELEQIYMNKVRILRDGSFSEISKVLSMEMSMYSALGMISKTQGMIDLHQQYCQLDVDNQRLSQLEYEYITKTQNRTILTEIDDEI